MRSDRAAIIKVIYPDHEFMTDRRYGIEMFCLHAAAQPDATTGARFIDQVLERGA